VNLRGVSRRAGARLLSLGRRQRSSSDTALATRLLVRDGGSDENPARWVGRQAGRLGRTLPGVFVVYSGQGRKENGTNTMHTVGPTADVKRSGVKLSRGCSLLPFFFFGNSLEILFNCLSDLTVGQAVRCSADWAGGRLTDQSR